MDECSSTTLLLLFYLCCSIYEYLSIVQLLVMPTAIKYRGI